jgi:TP901 family phage tail tape measure protein
MAEDRQQASITIKGRLDDSFSKSFKDALRDVNKLDQRIKNLGGDVSKLSSSNEHLKRTQDRVNDSFTKTNDKISLSSKLFNGFIRKLGAIAAGYLSIQAAGAAAMKTIQTTAEFGGRIGELRATLQGDATPAQINELESRALLLGRTTLFKATDVAQGMVELGKAGMNTNAILAAIPHTLDLATAGGIELGQAAEVMADAMAQFGLETNDAQRVTDVFSKAAAISTIGVSDLVESMKFLGPTVKQLGGSLEDASGLIALLGLGGLKGGIGTRAFATSLGQLAKPTKEQRYGLDRAGISAFEGGKFVGIQRLFADLAKGLKGRTDQDQLAIITSIFGAESAKSIQAVLGQGTDKLREFISTLESAEGFGKSFAEIKTDNLKGDLVLLGSSLEGLTLTVGKLIDPEMRFAVQGFSGALNNLSDLINTNTDKIRKVLDIAGAVGDVVTTPFSQYPARIGEFLNRKTADDSQRGVSEFITKKNISNALANKTLSGEKDPKAYQPSISMPTTINIGNGFENSQVLADKVKEALAEQMRKLTTVINSSTSYSAVPGGSGL